MIAGAESCAGDAVSAEPETADVLSGEIGLAGGAGLGPGVRAKRSLGSARTSVASSLAESCGGRAITCVAVGSSNKSVVSTVIDDGGMGAVNASGVSVGSLAPICTCVSG